MKAIKVQGSYKAGILILKEQYPSKRQRTHCCSRVQKDEFTQETVAASEPKEASTEWNLSWWSWISQPPQVWEINFCLLSHPGYGTFLWLSEQTKTEVYIKKHGISALGKLPFPYQTQLTASALQSLKATVYKESDSFYWPYFYIYLSFWAQILASTNFFIWALGGSLSCASAKTFWEGRKFEDPFLPDTQYTTNPRLSFLSPVNPQVHKIADDFCSEFPYQETISSTPPTTSAVINLTFTCTLLKNWWSLHLFFLLILLQ